MDAKRITKLTADRDNATDYLRLTPSERELLQWLRDKHYLIDGLHFEDIEATAIEF